MSSFGGRDLRTEMTECLMHIANDAVRQGITEKRFLQMMTEAVQYVEYVVEYNPLPEGPDLAALKSVLKEFLDLPSGDDCTVDELVRHQELVNEINRFIDS